jgi:chloride channel, nucleotide-sensitive, 1A
VADHGAFRKLLLYSSASEVGIAIPYPTIALHAIQSLPAPSTGEQQGLYMQLLSNSTNPEAGEEDDEADSISLTIIPQNDAPPPPTTTDPDSHTDDHSPQPATVAMFTALSNCSNLHPDPADDDQVTGLQDSTLFQAGMVTAGDASGGLPPPMPGSGGWITAENMGEFLDEQGNWNGGNDTGEEEALGAGAGTVRPRGGDEDHTAEENGANDESKWRRTG